VSVGASAGYGALALASLVAAASAYRYGDRIVAWDRRVRRRAFDRHPAFQLWHDPYQRPTPDWFWLPIVLFFGLLTAIFAVAAASAA
jgi:hypothetical protein